MKVVDAMSLRDGGTTCVTLEDAGVVTHVTVDHRLGHDPSKPRLVFTSNERFGRDRELRPGGDEERRYVDAIARTAVAELGKAAVADALAGRGEKLPRPWFYVLGFLRIVARERRVDVLAPIEEPKPGE